MSNDTKRAGKFLFSEQVQETLDPCVVLMKQMISEYAHLWKDSGGVDSLAQGVVYWEPPPTVNEAITYAMENAEKYQLHTYCPDEGLSELREALQQKLKEQNELETHNVMVTAGANQAYVNCVLTLLSQGDKCVIFEPYYFNHVMAIQMTQGNDALVIGDCSDEGIPDVVWLEKVLEEDKSIRMVTVVNPGNPTGVSLERDLLQRIVDLCGKRGVWLILDCTYEHFDHIQANRGNVPFPGFPEEHVIHIFSFSKGYALAGFRCGYIVLSQEGKLGKEAFEQMLKVSNTKHSCWTKKPNSLSSCRLALFFTHKGARHNPHMSFSDITGCCVRSIESGAIVGIRSSCVPGYWSGGYFECPVPLGNYHGRIWGHVRHGKIASRNGRSGETMFGGMIIIA